MGRAACREGSPETENGTVLPSFYMTLGIPLRGYFGRSSGEVEKWSSDVGE